MPNKPTKSTPKSSLSQTFRINNHNVAILASRTIKMQQQELTRLQTVEPLHLSSQNQAPNLPQKNRNFPAPNPNRNKLPPIVHKSTSKSSKRSTAFPPNNSSRRSDSLSARGKKPDSGGAGSAQGGDGGSRSPPEKIAGKKRRLFGRRRDG